MLAKKFAALSLEMERLPIQCADLLLERGHKIYGIISSDMEIGRWATSRDIEHIEPKADLLAILGRQPFDYLFSIANLHIRHKEMFKLPLRCAINYHKE